VYTAAPLLHRGGNPRPQLSFLMPNSLRSKPARHLGLLMTTICISAPAFPSLLQYSQKAGKMFQRAQKSVGAGFDHQKRAGPGADLDAVGAGGVFVADPEGVAAGQDRVGQLV